MGWRASAWFQVMHRQSIHEISIGRSRILPHKLLVLFEMMFLYIWSVTSSPQTFTEYLIYANDYLIIRESKNNETSSLLSVQAWRNNFTLYLFPIQKFSCGTKASGRCIGLLILESCDDKTKDRIINSSNIFFAFIDENWSALCKAMNFIFRIPMNIWIGQ